MNLQRLLLMIRYLVTSLLVSACLGITLHALENPLALRHPGYISSDQLQVILKDDGAEIDALLRFRSTATENHPAAKASVALLIPVWLPDDAKQADPLTADFLRSYAGGRFYKLDDTNRAAWDSAIGLTLSVGEQVLAVEDFSILDPRKKEDRERMKASWLPKGFVNVSVNTSFDPGLLKDDVQIRIRYRQGLRRGSKGLEFYYLPIFHGIPSAMNTQDLDLYSMNLINRSGSAVSLGTVKIGVGQSAFLPLSHEEPVRAVIEF